MSQKLTPEGAQKGFAVGRGLLAAAETLNYTMSESHSDSYGSSSQQLGGMVGGDGQDHDSQLPRRVGSHLTNTMKLFASLGLSPTDLDVLAQVPEENISVETLPHLIMQLKNRKVENTRHMGGDLPSISSDTSYRSRDDWGDLQGGRLERLGQSHSRASQGDFGYGSMQDVSARGYNMLDYSSGSNRDRQYSELSTDHYRGLGMGSSTSDHLQRRMGSPSQGKIQDFLGVIPQMFPHICSLCDFDVHSTMEWNQHTAGMRHAENRRVLLQLYPDWDPQMPSGRMSGSDQGRSEGLLGSGPSGGFRQRGGMNSKWGSDSGMGMSGKMQNYSTPKVRSRVVVVKYERKPVLSNLFSLARPFGTICEHLVLKKKAFLELQSHEEALAMSTYYHKKPATLHGKEVQIYVSKELLVIEKSDRPDADSRTLKGGTSPVVFFSNLPRETEKKMELLTICRRFGTVEKHLFLNDEAFVQMSNAMDAEMLVKYYTLHPLNVGRRSTRLNICTKYKTLTVPPGMENDYGQNRAETNRRNSSSRTNSKKSPRATSSKSKEHSSEKSENPHKGSSEESGEEGEGVVEAHDEEEVVLNESQDVEETNLKSEAEESVAEQLEPEAPLDNEDKAMDLEENDAHDTEGPEIPSEAGLEQEAQPKEPANPETDQENTKQEEELKEADVQDDVEHAEADENAPDDSSEPEGFEESDFPENMDEFVTLDELAEEEEADIHDSKSRDKSLDRSRESGGLRVVNVIGFKRGYGYFDEILSLAKPFGKVVRHLVLNVRPEAFLELSSEQEARAMVRFYNGNVIPSVCGKSVKIYHSQVYPTIQSGKVIYVGHIPPFKTSDASLLKIAEPFGKVRRYFLNKARNECFIEMERGEDAEKFVEAAKDNPPKFQGKRLVVYISRKYKQLKHGHRPPISESEDKRRLKRERSEEETETQETSPVKTNTKKEEEPPTKKIKEELSSVDNAESETVEKETQAVPCESASELKQENTEENTTDIAETQKPETAMQKDENDNSAADVPQKSQETNEAPHITAQSVKKQESTLGTLGPYEPNVPVGVEFVKMGYYCRVCFLFYSNEDTAKTVHCSSQAHYDKLKKHLEKEKAKKQSNVDKN